MKIKQAFVTNSSSTSFIVAWDKKLTPDDLDYVNSKVMNIEKAKIVLRNSLDQEPILLTEEIKPKCLACAIRENIEENFYWDPPDKEDLIPWLSENLGSYSYIYHYSDEDGKFWGEMEHGGTFNNLKHLRISHH